MTHERLFTHEDDVGLLEDALGEWGRGVQEIHAVEECSELNTALTRNVNGRNRPEDVIDEIADVLIVANQLAVIYGQEAVEERIEYKLSRLESRLEDYQEPESDEEVVR